MYFVPMFDRQEFVLVCRRSDYQRGVVDDQVFLVCRSEWNDPDSDQFKTFDLLLTSIGENFVDLYSTSDGAVVIVQQLPYSQKKDFIELTDYYSNQ